MVVDNLARLEKALPFFRKYLPDQIRDETRSVAHMAMIDAAERYKPNGSSYWHYAQFRIKGELINERRSWQYACHRGSNRIYGTFEQLRPPDHKKRYHAEEHTHRDELRWTMRKLLWKLPRKQRIAVYLSFFKNWPCYDIGNLLGVGQCTAMRLVHKGVENLRKKWNYW